MALARTSLSDTPHGAGLRNRRVTIQQLTTESGGGGFPTEDWTALGDEWMSKRDLSADERFVTNQLSAFAETQWQMAYRADMDPDLLDVTKKRRLVYQGRTHDIVAGTVIGLQRGIEILTLAGARTP